MSMQKKTLTVLVALAVGASFGAAAAGYEGGYGYGHDSYKKGGDKHYDDGSHNYNGSGNQANDESVVIDYDKYVWKYDWDYTTFYKINKEYKVNNQYNTTYQMGYTGDTKSKSYVSAYADAYNDNAAYAGQKSANLGAGLGLGLGVGLGVGVGEGGDSLGLGFGLLGLGISFNDADGLGIGQGAGAGAGAGLGLAGLMPDQDLAQTARADASVNVFSVSLIRSGNNTVGNTGATNGINTQQAISGQSALGQQSVNVNASQQF
ncbi:hypothetical protein HNR62_001982 [Oceanisphaera litoralis]|uniref:hypothetical protein n=1 Tax=Oceanisphaera litoralis TaxID=225144 RepID=UPI00195C6014|nr:hypothetical protein [Oceanisphaera litoralis]MBM7456101.1 hypothetical protein [Oceanisphaera litoralis]